MVEEKRTVAGVAFNVLNIAFFTIFSLICIFPFYYMFINTISNNQLVGNGQVMLLPIGIHFGNYIKIFNIPGLWNATFVSIGRTVIGTLLTLIASAFLGYVFTKGEYWKRKLWYRFVIVTMYFNAGLIPWYINMKNLGLLNNFLAYVLPSLVAPFYIILFKTYVEQIPSELEEAAKIDGAGYLTCFFKIILPISTPILATITVFASVDQWNSFFDTLFLMSNQKLFTLQFLLYQYLNNADTIAQMMRDSTTGMINPATLLTPSSIRMTISIVVTLPILFVYPFMQRYFLKGIMLGAVKG